MRISIRSKTGLFKRESKDVKKIGLSWSTYKPGYPYLQFTWPVREYEISINGEMIREITYHDNINNPWSSIYINGKKLTFNLG